MWEEELAGIAPSASRCHARTAGGQLRAAGVTGELDYITRQKGMFKLSGLSKDRWQRLRSEFGVYGSIRGRICVAAINSRNIDALVAALAQVMRDGKPSSPR